MQIFNLSVLLPSGLITMMMSLLRNAPRRSGIDTQRRRRYPGCVRYHRAAAQLKFTVESFPGH